MILRGKTALVTGASSGLGWHFAKSLSRAGASLIVAARRKDALEALAKEIGDEGGSVRQLALDVCSATDLTGLADALPGIDILVNNAGVVREAAAIDQSLEDWDAVIDTNLKGMFFVAKAAATAMCKHGRGGSIINIASVLGLRQAGGVLPYAVSKAGVIQMTKVLALEWARHGIRVNAIAPGYIETPLNQAFWASDAGAAMIRRIPQRRLGKPEDIDGALLLLASDASAYINGAAIVVDGGHCVSTL